MFYYNLYIYIEGEKLLLTNMTFQFSLGWFDTLEYYYTSLIISVLSVGDVPCRHFKFIGDVIDGNTKICWLHDLALKT